MQESKIFISYRREDTAGYAGRLKDALAEVLGEDRVFMDVDSIGVGADFVEVVEKAVSSCEILIALIGKRWLDVTDKKGQRRLDNPEDLVRVEIETALKRGIKVIPTTVQDAAMPTADVLPEPLTKLARRNAIELSDTRWKYDVKLLIETIEKELGIEPKEPPPRPPNRLLKIALIALAALVLIGVVGVAVVMYFSASPVKKSDPLINNSGPLTNNGGNSNNDELDLARARAAYEIEVRLETDLQDVTKKVAALDTLQKIVKRLAADKEIAEMLDGKNVSATTNDGMKIINALDEIKENAISFNRRDLVRKINLAIIEASSL